MVAAQAHPNLQNAMWVQFEPSLVRVAVNVSLKEITVAQSLALTESSAGALSMNRAAEAHREYLLKHLKLSAGANVLSGTVVKLTPPPIFGEPEQSFYQYELVYLFDGLPPAKVRFFREMLKEWPYAVGTAWDFSYVVQTKRSDASQVSTWLLRARQPSGILTG